MGSVLKALFSVTLIFSSFWNHRLGHSSHIYKKQRCLELMGISRLWGNLVELSKVNKERKGEIDSLRHDHEELKKNHEAFVTSAERENDLRKNEIKSLEEKMQKENQA